MNPIKDGGVVRFEVPKVQIDFIVDKFHVSATDDQIRADIRRRTGLSNARRSSHGIRKVTEKQIAKMEAYAVKRHHQNQELYNRVMGGK